MTIKSTPVSATAALKPLNNVAVAALVRAAFDTAFATKTVNTTKVTATGTGAKRNVTVKIEDDSFAADVLVGADNGVTAILRGTSIALKDWAAISKKAVAASAKTHEKVIGEFVTTQAKLAKKAAKKQAEADKKANAKAAAKKKEDDKKLKASLKKPTKVKLGKGQKSLAPSSAPVKAAKN